MGNQKTKPVAFRVMTDTSLGQYSFELAEFNEKSDIDNFIKCIMTKDATVTYKYLKAAQEIQNNVRYIYLPSTITLEVIEKCEWRTFISGGGLSSTPLPVPKCVKEKIERYNKSMFKKYGEKIGISTAAIATLAGAGYGSYKAYEKYGKGKNSRKQQKRLEF